jgi:hypothetical protein
MAILGNGGITSSCLRLHDEFILTVKLGSGALQESYIDVERHGSCPKNKGFC